MPPPNFHAPVHSENRSNHLPAAGARPTLHRVPLAGLAGDRIGAGLLSISSLPHLWIFTPQSLAFAVPLDVASGRHNGLPQQIRVRPLQPRYRKFRRSR